MTKTLLTKFLLICSIASFCQPKDTTILIIPCQSGELYIDGVHKGFVEADDAHRETISFGDHYLQLKTTKDKFSSTLKIDKEISTNIIKIGCSDNRVAATKLIDKQISLSGYLSADVEDNYFGLDHGDELKIKCEVLDKKGKATISVLQYESGSEIYRKDKFSIIDNESIKIPKKGIYKILLYTDALFGKNAKLIVERVASKNSKPDFNTSVHVVADTIATEIINTTIRVYSTTNLDHSSKTILRVNLPANTSYWTYWIGVGQESKEQMKQFVSNISRVGGLISTNPLVLFGMKMIPSLPMLNSTSTINYRFMDAKNAQLFHSNYNYSYYTFKYGNNIAIDYALINQPYRDLSLAFWNESSINGQDVEVRIVAFSIRRWFEMEN